MEAKIDAKLWHEAFSKEEIRDLHEMRDIRSWISVATNWAVIGAAFALVAWAPNPLTIVLALFLIGGRQLGLAVLMHEAAHKSLFQDRRVNDWVGKWLAAYPIWSDLDAYRRYHLRHHERNWTKDDPDLQLVTPFPITKESLRRKIWRDLSGQTGIKRARSIYAHNTAPFAGQGGDEDVKSRWNNFHGLLITNAVILGALTVAGVPWLYALWVGAWLTTYSLIMRIRSIAEHAMAPDPANPFQNTRTTLISWWEQIFVAPNRVNFHLEHHLLMAIPHYNLPRFHRMLRERGLLDEAWLARGYREVLANAASKTA